MRIAVPVEDGVVSGLFDESKWFLLCETEGKALSREMTVPAFGEGCDALVSSLSDYRVNVLLCGAISGKARLALEKAGILSFGGVSGNAGEAVNAFLRGTLRFAPERGCHDCDSCGDDSCESRKQSQI